MIWDVSGLDNTVYVVWGYKPDTSLAVQWFQKANGYYEATDRGSDEDVYESSVLFQGPASELADLEEVLNTERENFNISCGTGEEIFGADIDYSGNLDVTVVDFGKIQRLSYGKYSMPLRLRLLSPSFVSSPAASLSTLRPASWQYEAGSKFDVSREFTYDRIASYLDKATDPGRFEAVFAQTLEEMKAIRRYLRDTGRTAAFAFPNIGITKPFGQRRGDYDTFYTKIIEWEELGRENLIFWNLRLVFAEEPTP